jgi:hypothetical protein
MTYDAPVNVDFVYCMCVSWSNITEGVFFINKWLCLSHISGQHLKLYKTNLIFKIDSNLLLQNTKHMVGVFMHGGLVLLKLSFFFFFFVPANMKVGQ